MADEPNPSNLYIFCQIPLPMQQLIIFAKKPVLGKVKTRLATESSPEYALQIYKKLLAKTLRMAATLPNITPHLFVTEAGEWTLPYEEQGFHIFLQKNTPNLGERMAAAFETFFTKNEPAFCLIIGTDIPDISPQIIQHAFLALHTNDMVIGKTYDGGYYLLGMKEFYAAIFAINEWSTPNVFQLTMQKINEANLSVYQLPVLRDVDTLADWEHFKSNFNTNSLNDEL